MLPVTFPQSNFTYTKPEGWEDSECGNLPVYKELVLTSEGRRIPTIISCWQLNLEEINLINETGKIWLCLTLFEQVPCMVMVENPFAPEKYEDDK